MKTVEELDLELNEIQQNILGLVDGTYPPDFGHRTDVVGISRELGNRAEAIKRELKAIKPVYYDEPEVGRVSSQGIGKQFVLMDNGSIAVCGGNGSAQVWDYENQLEYQKGEGPCMASPKWQNQQWARAVSERVEL